MKKQNSLLFLAIILLFLGLLFMVGYGSEIIGVFCTNQLTPDLNQLFIAGFIFFSLSIFILGIIDYD